MNSLRLQRFSLLVTAILLIIISLMLFNISRKQEVLIQEQEELIEAQEELIELLKEYNRPKEITIEIEPETIEAIEPIIQQPIKEVVEYTGSDTIVSPIKFNVTAYCPCVICCGKSDGITNSGVKAKANKTIAMDKSYPMGTKVLIEGFEDIVFEKQDIGGAIKGNKLDIFFNTHQEALNFGRQQLDVYILGTEGN